MIRFISRILERIRRNLRQCGPVAIRTLSRLLARLQNWLYKLECDELRRRR